MNLPELLEGDLVAAARRRLLDDFANQPDMLGAEGLIGRDEPGGPWEEGWIFAGGDNDGRPYRPVEGTGKASIVLLNRDHWNTNQHNTMVMPVLRVLIYADTLRDASGNPSGRFAELVVKNVAKHVDRVLHDAANRNHWWNVGKDEELYVISCLRTPGGGLNIMDVPDNDFACRGDLRYEVALAEWG